MRRITTWAALFLAVWFAGGASLVHAQDLNAEQITRLGREIRQQERTLADKTPDGPDVLAQLLARANEVRSMATDCVQTSAAEQTRLSGELAALGPATEDDAGGVVKARKNLEDATTQAAQRVGECRLLALEAQRVVTSINLRQQQILASRLLTKGPDFTELLRRNLSEPLIWLDFARNFLLRDSGLLELPAAVFAGLVALAALAAWSGFVTQRRLRARLARREVSARMTDGLIRGILATFARYAPYLATSLVISGYLTVVSWGQWPLPFITLFAYGLVLYYLLVATIRLILAPAAPASPYLPLPADLTRKLAQRLRVLALLLLLGFLLFATLLSWDMPEVQYLLVRGVYVAFLVINLIWVTWLTGRLASSRRGHGLGFLLALVLLAALVAEGLGYRNLTQFLMVGLVGSLLGLGLMRLISSLLGELFDSLDEGRYRWERRLREVLGLHADEYIPGLNWLRFLAHLALLAVLALWLLRIWGLSAAGFATIARYVTDGFPVGGVQVVPARVLWAILTFALLLTFFRWFKQQLAQRWSPKMRIDRGARDALVTTTGYLGAAIAFFVMLSIAGIKFTNLAIIAGALSVGIGFGLQNVVNNFVSGLILLLERPIRTGDWIVVGATEGMVKRISIRSTQIQTFDRADVIVPNSELISGQVTNWMLGDPYGRVVIPIGVAYGSDPGKVRDLLLSLALAHPLVMHGVVDVQDPSVIFRRLGDYSLDFELRCVIRDVEKRLIVLSDLNFAIEATFRKEGIEIPFPQREVFIRNWPEQAS